MYSFIINSILVLYIPQAAYQLLSPSDDVVGNNAQCYEYGRDSNSLHYDAEPTSSLHP